MVLRASVSLSRKLYARVTFKLKAVIRVLASAVSRSKLDQQLPPAKDAVVNTDEVLFLLNIKKKYFTPSRYFMHGYVFMF